MRARTLAALVVVVVAAFVASGAAYADPKADASNKIKAAMKAYDAFEYAAAKKLLTQAIAVAKKGKLDKDPILARAYVDLGIVMFAVPDLEAARAAFRSAVQIDPNIQVELAYKSPELAKLFDRTVVEVLAEAEPGAPLGLEPPSGCAAVRGIEHTPVRTAKAGSAIPIEVRVGADTGASRVSVMYRAEGEAGFTELPLDKQRDCRYSGAVPDSALSGGVVYYYVAAFKTGRTPVVTKGSAELPNSVAISGAAPTNAAVAELVTHAEARRSDTPANTSANTPTILLAIAGGGGLGYLRGTTEDQNTVTRCCLGTNLAVATAEAAYFINPNLLVGGVFRFGAPIGANTVGHSRGAFAGLGRLRYAFSRSGYGFHVMAQAGFGILRHTVKLADPMFDVDTDVVAQGPLLVGGGIGTAVELTARLALLVDLSVIAGVAVVDHLGNSPLNTGVAGDLTLGLALVL